MVLSTKAALSKDKATGTSVQLQHRHFAFIAAVIARMPSSEARNEAANAFVGALRHTNPNFDQQRFLLAAGVLPFIDTSNRISKEQLEGFRKEVSEIVKL